MLQSVYRITAYSTLTRLPTPYDITHKHRDIYEVIEVNNNEFNLPTSVYFRFLLFQSFTQKSDVYGFSNVDPSGGWNQ